MKLNKSTQNSLTILTFFIPLLTLPFNTNFMQQFIKIDLLSGYSITASLAAIILPSLIITIYRLIYKEKNNKEIISISLILNLLNTLNVIIIILGGLYPLKFFKNEFSSNFGSILSVIILLTPLQNILIEKSLGKMRSQSKLSTKEIVQKIPHVTKRPIVLVYTAVVVFLGTLAYLNNSLIFAVIPSIVILIWQLIYIFLLQQTLLRLLKDV